MSREINQLLSYEERVHILHLSQQHCLTDSEISKILGMKYVTIRAITKMWKTTGRINKLLPYSAKKQLLKNRAQTNIRLGRSVPTKAKFCGINLIVKSSDPSDIEGTESYDLSKPKLYNIPHVNWTNFTSIHDYVERNDFEYKINKDDKDLKQIERCDVFSGTMTAFNFSDPDCPRFKKQ